MTATSFLIQSSSILQVTRTAIKSRMNSTSSHIRLFTSRVTCPRVLKKPIFDLVRSIVPSILIRSSSNLQAARTAINSRMSSNFGQIRLLTSKVTCPWMPKISSHILLWWKCCLIGSVFIFDWIFLILAGNKGSHKISEEFEFQPDQTIHFGITCLWGSKIFPIDYL